MPVHGLIALLDDIAAIADDVGTLAAVAAKKTSGVVTDDMAVTAEQAIGIRREREIPVVLAVARGSLFNKLALLTPGALLLNAVAPWAIHPVLMAGGAFLCFEGVEKVLHSVLHRGEASGAGPATPTDPDAYERERVSGAVRTDLVLSGEIIAITLGEVATEPFATQAAVLVVISLVMTVGVYGIVGGLIKLDDLGELLTRRGGGAASVGRVVLAGAPKLLHGISVVGTVAMLMVGGHILLEGVHPLAEAVHHALEGVPAGLAHGLAAAVVDIALGALAGLALVGVGATGVPGRLWSAVVRPFTRKGQGQEPQAPVSAEPVSAEPVSAEPVSAEPASAEPESDSSTGKDPA